MKFNGRREFGQRALTILRRIGHLIWCNQLCRTEHADLAQSIGIDSRGFLSQTLSIFRGQFKRLARRAFQFGFLHQGFMLQAGDLSSLLSFRPADQSLLQSLEHGAPFMLLVGGSTSAGHRAVLGTQCRQYDQSRRPVRSDRCSAPDDSARPGSARRIQRPLVPVIAYQRRSCGEALRLQASEPSFHVGIQVRARHRQRVRPNSTTRQGRSEFLRILAVRPSVASRQ